MLCRDNAILIIRCSHQCSDGGVFFQDKVSKFTRSTFYKVFLFYFFPSLDQFLLK